MGRLLTRTDPENFSISEEAQNYAALRSGKSEEPAPEKGKSSQGNPPKQSPLRNPLQHQSQLLRNQNDPLSRNRNWRFLLLMPTSWHLPKFQVQ